MLNRHPFLSRYAADNLPQLVARLNFANRETAEGPGSGIVALNRDPVCFSYTLRTAFAPPQVIESCEIEQGVHCMYTGRERKHFFTMDTRLFWSAFRVAVAEVMVVDPLIIYNHLAIICPKGNAPFEPVFITESLTNGN